MGWRREAAAGMLASAVMAAALGAAVDAWLRGAAADLGPSPTLVAVFSGAALVGFGLGAARARLAVRPGPVGWFQWGTLAAAIGLYLMLSPLVLAALLYGYWRMFAGSVPSQAALNVAWFAAAAVLSVFPFGLASMSAVSLLSASPTSVQCVGPIGAAAACAAPAGIAVGELLLVPRFGTDGAALTAGFVLALTGAAALAAFLVTWRDRVQRGVASREEHAPLEELAFEELAAPFGSLRGRWALVFSASVCAGLALPAGARALVITFGPTSDSLMLTLATCGLAAAVGFLMSPRLLRCAPVSAGAAVAVGLCAAIVLATSALGRLPYAYLAAFDASHGTPGLMLWYELGLKVAVLAVPIALTAILIALGMGIGRTTASAGAMSGATIATSAAGFGLGAGVLLGTGLLPLLGARGELLLSAGLLGGLAVILLVATNRQAYLKPLAILAVGLIYFGYQGARWDAPVITGGPYVHAPGLVSDEPVPAGEKRPSPAQRMLTRQILALREGSTGTVSVATIRRPAYSVQMLQINGRTVSSTADLTLARGVAHLPMLLHPEPRRVLVLGLGAGLPLSSVLAHGSVEKAVCLEPEGRLQWMGEFFASASRGALSDKRAEVRIGPWLPLLGADAAEYDVICGELPPLWAAGGSVWLDEPFFRRLRARLSDHGLVCLSVPLVGLDPETFRGAMRKLQVRIPHVRLWILRPRPHTVLVTASPQPIPLDLARVISRMQEGAVFSDLRDLRSGLTDLWAIAEAQALDEAGVEAFLQGPTRELSAAGLERRVAQHLGDMPTISGAAEPTSLAVLQAIYSVRPVIELAMDSPPEPVDNVVEVPLAAIACRLGQGWGAPTGKLVAARRGGDAAGTMPRREAWAELDWPTPYGKARVRCSGYDPMRPEPAITHLSRALRGTLGPGNAALVPGGGPAEHYEWAVSSSGELAVHLTGETSLTRIVVLAPPPAGVREPESAARAIADHIRGVLDARRDW